MINFSSSFFHGFKSSDVLNNPGIHGLLESIAGVTHERLAGAVRTWALAMVVCLRKLLLHGLVGSRQENDLAISSLGHCLHSLKISDLHGWCRRQNVGSLAHKLGGLDFSACGNDFRLSNTLALGSHRERVLQVGAENDVLDQHALDLNAPSGRDILDDFTNRLCDLFTTLNNILKDAGANNVAKRGLCALHESLADIANAESGFVGRGDVVVDDGGKVESDVVFSHTDLLWDLCRVMMVSVLLAVLSGPQKRSTRGSGKYGLWVTYQQSES